MDGPVADLAERVAEPRQSYALLLKEAHDARAIISGLPADLSKRLSAIEA
jgi:hypothetical protein